MLTSVKKWGNSLGIRIPKSIADEVLINEGTNLRITINNGVIQLTKYENDKKLDDLLSLINPENLHGEIYTADNIGKEL